MVLVRTYIVYVKWFCLEANKPEKNDATKQENKSGLKFGNLVFGYNA